MKQIIFNHFGPPSSVVQCVQARDVGEPTSWEIVVDVEMFPINVADLAMLAGRYGTLPKPPSPIGMEAVGRVAEIGASVKGLAPGDRVVLLANNNWAERRKVPAAAVHKVSSTGDVQQYAMLKVNPATAYLLLTLAGDVKSDSYVLLNAPLSSVGRCLIQLAKRMGIRTINVVRDESKRAEITTLGGTYVVEDGPHLAEHVTRLIDKAQVHVAFDAVGGMSTKRLAECLSPGGQIINYGMLSGEPCMIEPEQTIFREVSLKGFWLSKVLNRLAMTERVQLFNYLAEAVDGKELKIAVDSIHSISAIQEAIGRAEMPGRTGKVLVATKYFEGSCT